MITALLMLGILLLPVLYQAVIPLRIPELKDYFTPGQSYQSEAYGVTMHILRQEGERVHCEFRFAPGAGGAAAHRHEEFEQSGTVAKGTLVVRADKQLLRIPAGGRLELPRGTTHLLSNHGTGEVLLRCEGAQDALPVGYVYGLTKRYPFTRKGTLNLGKHAMACVLEQHFDSYPAGWSPAFIRIMRKLGKPYARILVERYLK